MPSGGMDAFRRVTASDLRRVARRYLRGHCTNGAPRGSRDTSERRGAPGDATMTSASKSRPRVAAGIAPERFELEGGTLALLESSHDLPLVSLVVALHCGSDADPADKAGLARIAMRMLRRGCDGASPPSKIDFRIDALGAEMAVDTSHSTVAIHAQVIARNVDAFVDLLARMLSTPTFPEDELGRLKRESVAEIIEARDNDRAVAQKAMQRALFEGHPYGISSGGTTQTVPAIGREDVLSFYRRFVVKRNIVVGITLGT